MLLKRLLTAAVGIPLVVYLVHTGGIAFAAAVLFLECVALYELDDMIAKKGTGIYLFPAVFFAILFCYVSFSYDDAQLLFLLFLVSVITVLLLGIVFHQEQNWFHKNIYTIFALSYVGTLFPLFILLRQVGSGNTIATSFCILSQGEVFLWLCLLGTWASDTFAFFVGTAIGKNKMCPKISPNKSWEGALAGFIGCVATVWLLGEKVFFVQNVNLIIMGLLIAFIAPLGDLVESQLKRFFAIKDSGSVFPGHGGVLDRLDSLLLVIPVVYVYINFTLR